MPSVYEKAVHNRRIAAYMLLPLMEFEFAFHGAQKPAITQSEQNLPQLRALHRICRKHGWLSSDISRLGNKNEYWFKVNNKGFQEIYKLAGPLADKTKDKWAVLLAERSEASDKNRNIKNDLLKALRTGHELTTRELCLEVRRLPYTVTRHLRKLERQKLIKKSEKGWIFISAGISANSPS